MTSGQHLALGLIFVILAVRWLLPDQKGNSKLVNIVGAAFGAGEPPAPTGVGPGTEQHGTPVGGLVHDPFADSRGGNAPPFKDLWGNTLTDTQGNPIPEGTTVGTLVTNQPMTGQQPAAIDPFQWVMDRIKSIL